MNRALLAAVVLASGAGCTQWRALNTHASPRPETVTTVAPEPSRFATVPAANELVCEGDSCKDCWERAQVWVAGHARWNIQSATDALIQTYGPGDTDSGYGFTITKEPLGAGRYRIVMDQYCVSGCEPTADELHRAFYYYLRTGHDLLAGAVASGSGVR